VVVSGTHGKTTTTSLVAALLQATGWDPSLLVGGISLDFAGSFQEGDGPHFVVEGDEYDTAFFDKTPKFLHYHPHTLILTSVEFDHADIYRDIDHVKSAFRELVSKMPEDGLIIADWRGEHVRDVLESASCRVLRYWVDEPGAGGSESSGDAGSGADAGSHVGTNGESRSALDADTTACREQAEWIASALEPGPDGTHFELRVGGGVAEPVHTPLYGAFNVANCLAALATVSRLGIPLADCIAALPHFKGVKRRQEIRGVVRGVTVVDDFAHHPTAVKGSIGALLARFPGRRLVVIFEARTNTSRRAIFQDAYANAFTGAARVLIREMPDEPIYSATGDPTELFSAESLVDSLAARGIPARVFEDIDALAVEEAGELSDGDVVLVMSNGDFGNIWEKLLAALARE
jgi:UDP-N-acetylmuramate: L-alanyl-gamma-D-glutamyl-meso-diaminopimelate ligase